VRDLYAEFLDKAGVERRKGQADALALLNSLSDGEADSFAIQAPTGTGKSYAALLAGVHNARLGRRTVIGTSTLVLSDQYASDMALVEKHFPEVDFFVLKGASNYYCGNKAADELKRAKPKRAAELKAELFQMTRMKVPVAPFWCAADTEYCRDCQYTYRTKGKTACEYARARKAALDADVVVTTHAMISVDVRMRILSKEENNVLGDVWLTIFDEAHKAASSLVYSESFSPAKLRKLDWWNVSDAMPFARRRDFAEHFSEAKQSDWYTPTRALGEKLLELWPTKAELAGMAARADMCPDKEKFELGKSVDFLERSRKVVEEISRGQNDGGVALWFNGRSYKMQDMIPEATVVSYLQAQRVAWLSATIGTHSQPTYSLTKCGLNPKFFDLESPFDFAKQLRWAVRTEGASLPQPDLIAAVNGYIPGGTVVLTSSHRRKDRIVETLQERVGAGVLVQGQAQPSGEDNGNATNKYAIQQHKDAAADGGSPVLVGVEVFSTGMDLPGDGLTKLVIAGLFPLRDDAAYANWRRRWLESVGGDGFEGYELPERAIALEPQIGRVIRRETDEGVVIFYVDDRDWKSGSYGRRVIEESLKRFPGVGEL
jgi:Rad3-related DNA helicase